MEARRTSDPNAPTIFFPPLELLNQPEQSSQSFQPLRLLFLAGGHVLDITKPEVVVGRHTEVDVRLSHPEVSRQHCRLRFVEGRWQVEDLGSLNGTEVNGAKVSLTYLAEGDRLRIGNFIFGVQLVRRDENGPEDHIRSIVDVLAQPPLRRAS
ncbi:MAG: FHA domain-containing protein [Gemmataceae bacterium]